MIKKEIRIVGIDPGLVKTGWGVVRFNCDSVLSYVDSGVIYTDAKKKVSERLKDLYDGLSGVLSAHNPQYGAIEEVFVNKNPLSSLKLGHARGALILSASLSGIELSEYPAKTIKKSVVGVGNADKKQVIHMVRQILPGCDVKLEDEADALAVAICHSGYLRVT